MNHDDELWMREALSEARRCLRTTEIHIASGSDPQSSIHNRQSQDVPVGAICVWNGQIIGRGHNRREHDHDPIAHAETLCLREASQFLQSWHLDGATLYVTLEPCPMCAGALWLSRVSRVVFGAWDERAGACGSVFDILRDPRLNHRPQVCGGVLETECATLLRDFFAARRSA